MANAPGRANAGGSRPASTRKNAGNCVVEVIEDVIEQSPVEAAGVGLHVEPAREDPVHTVYEQGDCHVNDGDFPLVDEDGAQGEKSPHQGPFFPSEVLDKA